MLGLCEVHNASAALMVDGEVVAGSHVLSSSLGGETWRFRFRQRVTS